MATTTRHLTTEGDQISHTIGRFTVTLTVIRPGASYRVSVCHSAVAGQLGAEIEPLSRSYDTETEARQVARRLCEQLNAGRTILRLATQASAANLDGAPLTLVPRSELPRPTGAVTVRMTDPQYRLLRAAQRAGTAEITRAEGEASITTLRAMARAGFVELVTNPWADTIMEPYGAVVGATVTGWGWRALSAEGARRTGKVPPEMVPVPTAALAEAAI